MALVDDRQEARLVASPRMNGVAVVICTRNRPKLLECSVDAVLAGNTRPTRIIVVDQSSATNEGFVRRSSSVVRYVPDAGTGVSRARNIGLRLADAGVIALIDDDILVSPDWLGALVDGLHPARPLLRTGSLSADPGAAPAPWRPSLTEFTTNSLIDRPGRSDVLFTGNMALTAAVIERVGYFDERLGPGTPWPAAEDNDYAHRALRVGIPIERVVSAAAVHLDSRDARQLMSLRWRYGRGQGAFYAKHLGSDTRWVLSRAASEVGRRAKRSMRGLVSDRGVFRHESVYLAGLVSGSVSWGVRSHRWGEGPGPLPRCPARR